MPCAPCTEDNREPNARGHLHCRSKLRSSKYCDPPQLRWRMGLVDGHLLHNVSTTELQTGTDPLSWAVVHGPEGEAVRDEATSGGDEHGAGEAAAGRAAEPGLGARFHIRFDRRRASDQGPGHV